VDAKKDQASAFAAVVSENEGGGKRKEED